eukprot:9781098-Ditylum_brightwellii.AAC.1
MKLNSLQKKRDAIQIQKRAKAQKLKDLRYDKRRKVSALVYAGMEHSLNWFGNVGLGVSVCYANIDDCIGVALPKVADHEIPIQGAILLLIFLGDGFDGGFLLIKLMMESKLDPQRGTSCCNICHATPQSALLSSIGGHNGGCVSSHNRHRWWGDPWV